MQATLDAEKETAAGKLKVLSDMCMIIVSRQEKLGIMQERGKFDRDVKVV